MNKSTRMRHNIHVGIDLGTTNTVMATCKKSLKGILKPSVRPINQYIMAKHIGMHPSLPSVLYFEPDGEVKVGKYAQDKKNAGAGKRILYNTKIDIGREVEYSNGFTPVKAATEILKVCYDTIKQTVMGKDDFDFPNVTITVPASFNQNQIADTLQAAHLAGFENVSILEEPVAALFNYINNQSFVDFDEEGVDFSTQKRVMVYDIGGGTCDVCVVDFQIDEEANYDIHFVATNRYTEFGGNDFDEQVAIGLLNKLFRRYNVTDEQIDSPDIKNDLVAQIIPFCEEYKKWYSTQLRLGFKDNKVPNAHFGQLQNFLNVAENVELDVTYKEYEEYTQIFFNDDYRHPTRDLTDKMRDKHVLKPVHELLKKLQLQHERGIDCVFLTGGMSEYLPIQTALEQFCKCPVIKAEEPMESVALGASISKFIAMNKDTSNVVDIQKDPIHEEYWQLYDAPLVTKPKKETVRDDRPRLPEAIFIDIENQLPMKIIDANITIPCRGEVHHEFHVGARGVRFHLFAGQSQWDSEMRVLYDYAQDFNTLVKPGTAARIKYEIDEDRFLKMKLVLSDARRQEFDLTVDTFKR